MKFSPRGQTREQSGVFMEWFYDFIVLSFILQLASIGGNWSTESFDPCILPSYFSSQDTGYTGA